MAEADLSPWLTRYLASLTGKAAGTLDVYRRTLRDFTRWLAERPGGQDGFQPAQLTQTAVSVYIEHLADTGYSRSQQTRTKAVLSGFARWLIEEEGALQRNPTRAIQIPPAPALAPRELTPDQRFVLRTLVERDDTPRGAAIFSLGYWAGCRVSDVSWLLVEHTHVTRSTGWLTVGHKGGKQREIDLHPEARRALWAYLEPGLPPSPFVFPSQRSERLTEAGIHHWFRTLKALATKDEWPLIADVAFHDLRHDFAHRARAAGWSLEEVAYYLGHLTHTGAPAIQTTVRYTQVSRAQVSQKVRSVRG